MNFIFLSQNLESYDIIVHHTLAHKIELLQQLMPLRLIEYIINIQYRPLDPYENCFTFLFLSEKIKKIFEMLIDNCSGIVCLVLKFLTQIIKIYISTILNSILLPICTLEMINKLLYRQNIYISITGIYLSLGIGRLTFFCPGHSPQSLTHNH